MSNTAVLYAELSTYAGLTALVGTRIYNVVMPQNPTLPAVVFQQIADERLLTLADSGGNGVTKSRIRITAYADTIASANAIRDQIRGAISAATTLNGWYVFGSDEYEFDTKLYSAISDYNIWINH